MRYFRNLLFSLLFVMLFVGNKACADSVWINDMVNLFRANQAVIYELNIRTFGAKDLNGDGIIDETSGESRGTFENAIPYLDGLVKMGINTIHLLPITPVGKTKALGTAGSLYAASSFNQINNQLSDNMSGVSPIEQARDFINECHKRKIRVIVDLPACGSYDLYMKHPEYFIKDKNGNPVIPSDWTDVRVLNSGTSSEVNPEVYSLYEGFLNLMFDIGADGIRADVASLKTPIFWEKLIKEAKARDPQFLFLAESYNKAGERPSEYAPFTPYNKLLDAGFDGYYSNFSDIKNWTNAKDLYNCVNYNMSLLKRTKGQKSVISSFTTHDETSPILVHGSQYSIMMAWLSATLPFNQYYTDGFSTGDSYIYPWANRKADMTFTDDDYYFAHRGKLDIFNFSRKPGGDNLEILKNLIYAQRFRNMSGVAMQKGSFKILRTQNSQIFAYERVYNSARVVVVGNLDFRNAYMHTKIRVPDVNKELTSLPVKALDYPIVENGLIYFDLYPGDIQVIYFDNTPPKMDNNK